MERMEHDIPISRGDMFNTGEFLYHKRLMGCGESPVFFLFLVFRFSYYPTNARQILGSLRICEAQWRSTNPIHAETTEYAAIPTTIQNGSIIGAKISSGMPCITFLATSYFIT